MFWDNSRVGLKQTAARDLLDWLMELADMPDDLAGTVKETERLLQNFSHDLQPDHVFWQQLAQVVQIAFPEQTLASGSLLARNVHQFRYVISAYQAQWVRQHFPAKTDRESLLLYLKGKRPRRFWRRRFDFDLTESSRLHNKLPKQPAAGCQLPANMKIVMAFHTEFILDSQGSFANELDPQEISFNGIINGASFNYANANNRRHHELDIAPVKPHDPLFRKKILANAGNAFVSPCVTKRRRHDDWERSYFNAKGYYARQGKSAFSQVVGLRRCFARDLKGL